MAGVPDFVALVLVFWSIHQPLKVGIGVAFAMGLVMDVHDAIYLGENALAYTLLSYFAITIHRRVLWFHPVTQCLHVFPLFVCTGLQTGVRLLIAPEAHFPGWLYFSQSLVTTLLWPVATLILLAPQRRAIDKDHTRLSDLAATVLMNEFKNTERELYLFRLRLIFSAYLCSPVFRVGHTFCLVTDSQA
jgi:rod shape-determining protein MreD